MCRKAKSKDVLCEHACPPESRLPEISVFNPLPTNSAHVASWTLHKPIGIYMRDLFCMDIPVHTHSLC